MEDPELFNEHSGLVSEGRELSMLSALPREYASVDEDSAKINELRAQIEQVMEQERHLVDRLGAAVELTKRTQGELKCARIERLRLEVKLKAVGRSHHLMSPKSGPLEWVDSYWFGAVCSCVVCLNLAAMIKHDSITESSAALFDTLFLIWYGTELGLKFAHHGAELFMGPFVASSWNWLDLAIVLSGVVDQWLSPIFLGHRGGSALATLRLLRLFRFLRFLKLVKAFLIADLDWLYESQRFDMFIASVIGVNGLIMSFQLDIEWAGWVWIDNFFLVIYLFELFLRLKRWGMLFFVHHLDWAWNWLDFSIVGAGVIDLWFLPGIMLIQNQILGTPDNVTAIPKPIMSLVRLMRLCRVLRLVRVLRSVPPLYTLLIGVGGAFQAMKWVIVLTLLTLYAGAIVFTNLVGKGMIYGGEEAPEDALAVFGSMGASLFSLFEMMNGDTDVIKPLNNVLAGKFLFAGFMVVANWAILAILTAVVSDQMIATSQRFSDEERQKHAELAHQRGEERLLEIFLSGDPDRTGRISRSKWQQMVDDKAMQLELSEGSHLSKADMVDIFDCLAIDDDSDDDFYVDYHDLIHSLKANATVADKRSVLHVMIRLRAMQDQLSKEREKHSEQLNSRFDDMKDEMKKLFAMQPAA